MKVFSVILCLVIIGFFIIELIGFIKIFKESRRTKRSISQVIHDYKVNNGKQDK